MVQQQRTHRVTAASTRVRLANGLELPVVDLSLGGACLATREVLAGHEQLFFELRHPHLPGPASLRAEVVWSRHVDGPGSRARAGVRFVDLNGVDRLRVRRCMLAEFGHGIYVNEPQRPGQPPRPPLGYLVPTGADRWSVYDGELQRVADLRRAAGRLHLERSERASVRAASAADAAAQAFELERLPRLDPPLELLEPIPGSAVLEGGRPIGYVACTGGSTWSFFDLEREPLGFMTRGDDDAWRIVVFGSNEDGSLELRQATSYPDALAAAFGLAQPPELRSTTFRPAQLLEAV